MTQKPKIQLSSFYFLLILLLSGPLIGGFIVPSFFGPIFLSFFVLSLIASFVFLRISISRKKAVVDLEVQDINERRNLLDSEINNEQIAIHSFQEKIISASQLKGLTERLSSSLNLEDTVETFSAEINSLFSSEETTIILYLFHTKTGELGLSSSQKGQMRVNIKTKKGDDFDQWVAKTMQPLLIEDTHSDYRFDLEKIHVDDSRTIKSLISVPLMVGNKALGILRIDGPKSNYFKTEDLRFLQTIGDLGAVAIENAHLYEDDERLAIRDSLTGLYLRRYLLDRLPEEISRQVRRKSNVSFLMIDIDYFKKYNDKFGHIAGDIVLKTAGTLLSEYFNDPGCLVCRYGGEEFCVLLPDCTKAKAQQKADEIRDIFSKEEIILRREKSHVTISIGVASYPKDASTKEELIHKADEALYKAKNEGRNRVCVA